MAKKQPENSAANLAKGTGAQRAQAKVVKAHVGIHQAQADDAMRGKWDELTVQQACDTIAKAMRGELSRDDTVADRQVRAAQQILDRTVGRPRPAPVRLAGVPVFGEARLDTPGGVASAIETLRVGILQGLVNGDQAELAMRVIDRGLNLLRTVDDSAKAAALDPLIRIVSRQGDGEVAEKGLERALAARKATLDEITERTDTARAEAEGLAEKLHAEIDKKKRAK